MLATTRLLLSVLLVLAACGGDDSGGDATADATADATPGDATADAVPDAPPADATADAPPADGATCESVAVGQLCVRGTPNDSGEALTADTPVRFMVVPEGCRSSACTIQEVASCTATVSDSAVQVVGQFCLRTEGECVSPDCGGGGFAECMLAESLPNGDYTATVGGLSVSFTIPSTVGFGGECDGTPF